MESEQSLSHAGLPAGFVVLGMHRSGTSLATHLLIALGCDPGGPLMPPKPDNPLGYWEHSEAVQIHDDFLLAAGRSWADPTPWTEEDFRSPAADAARRRIEALFRRDFQSRPRWVLKDPRLCRLLPLWSGVLAHSGHRVVFVHLLRSPEAVAASLAARNGLAPESAQVLWLRHMLESELWTRGRPRTWLDFETLVESPARTLKEALDRLDLGDPFDVLAAASAVAEVAKPTYVHHRSAVKPPARNSSWISRAVRALDELRRREDPIAHAALDAVAREVAAAESELLFTGTFDWLGATAREHVKLVHELKKELDGTQGYAAKLIEHIGRLTEHQQEVKEYVSRVEHELARKSEALDSVTARFHDQERTVADLRLQLERLSTTARPIAS